MAVIRCRVADGNFKVEEVVEFERGDMILLEKSTGATLTPNPAVFTLIQCPPGGGSDCPWDKAFVLEAFPGSGKVPTTGEPRD